MVQMSCSALPKDGIFLFQGWNPHLSICAHSENAFIMLLHLSLSRRFMSFHPNPHPFHSQSPVTNSTSKKPMVRSRWIQNSKVLQFTGFRVG